MLRYPRRQRRRCVRPACVKSFLQVSVPFLCITSPYILSGSIDALFNLVPSLRTCSAEISVSCFSRSKLLVPSVGGQRSVFSILRLSLYIYEQVLLSPRHTVSEGKFSVYVCLPVSLAVCVSIRLLAACCVLYLSKKYQVKRISIKMYPLAAEARHLSYQSFETKPILPEDTCSSPATSSVT